MKQELINKVKAAYAAINIVSYEERRVEAEIKAVADATGYNIFFWSITDGIVGLDGSQPCPGTEDPYAVLDNLPQLPEKSILLLRDYHLHFENSDPVLIRKFKNAIAVAQATNRVLIIVGCRLKMQPELEKEIAVIEFKLPGKEELALVAQNIAKSAGIELNGSLDALTDAASGLTTTEAENAFSESYVKHKELRPEAVFKIKSETLKKNNIVEIINTDVGMDDVGGADDMKSWICRRSSSFGQKAKDFGLPNPKGVLIVGIPGCGKSLACKATANAFKRPLLKLDGGAIFGSLVGESERNLRQAIQTAEAIAPCVLLVDEIEKSFSGSKSSGSTDGGTSARVFGTFLQWMNDKKSQVFVVATANDISQLPPEFLRKGRFDELFFIDLPTPKEREDILQIQIKKYGRKPSKYDIAKLVEATVDFTGAEIEAAFVESMYAAFDEDKEPSTKHILDAIAHTVPLAKTMSGEIANLRSWAKGRARRATTDVKSQEVGRKLA